MKEISVILLFIVSFFLFYSVVGVNQPIYAIPDFNFGAAGDWGCTSNTDATLTNMNGKGPERVFGLGDYSYASTGSCFFTKIDGSGLTGKTKIAIGNHEDDDSEGFSGYMSHFSQSQTYFSYNHENVHILVIDTDRNSYASGSAQRNFVQQDLQQASTDPGIKWIIVYLHKPMYTSPNTCGSSSCSNTGSENTNIRNGFGPMFDQFGVDLVLQGHVHNYQRTFTLKYNPGNPSSPTITSNNADTYTEGNGAVYAVVGTGGVNFHALSGKASFTSSQQDDFFGQLDIKITDNGNKLEGKFYRNGNNDILDSFSISKAGNSPPVASNQAVTVNKDTPTPIILTATDANNDPLTCSIVAQPLHGTIPPTGPCGVARTYTPVTGYVGPDTFTFKANDGTMDSNVATVTINVIGSYNYAPSLVLTGSNFQDVASTPSLQLSQFSVAAWFKTSANFGSDAFIVNKGDIGSDSSGQNMNYGIWMTSTEQIKAGFETSTGADQFATSVSTYNDGQWHYVIVQYDGITVRLYIDGVQVATKSTSGASPETSGTEPVRVGANSGVTPPGNFFTGEVDEVRIWSDDLTSTERANAFAGTSFNTGEQILYIPFGSNSPPVASNQAVTVNKDTPTPIILTATDANNDPLTCSIVAQPLHGTIPPTGPCGVARTYTPATGYVGPDTFTFKANDGTMDSNVATVTINVIGSYNYAPSLVLTGSNFQDVASTPSLQLSQFSVAAWFKTSANFGSDAFIVNKGDIGSDSSGQNMNYGIWMTSTEQIKAGFETSTGADQFATSVSTYNDGQWHYVIVQYDGITVRLYIDGVQVATKSTSGASPETSGTEPVRVGANSGVTPPGNFFTGEVDEVRIWSDDLTSTERANAFAGTSFNTGEQILYIPFGSNSPPVASNQAVTVNKDTPTPIILTATDANNDPLTCSIVAQPLHGTIPPTGPCGVARTYTPATGYVGPDTFTFKANDGTMDSNVATVTINVIGSYNYAPSLVLTGSNFQDVASTPSLQLSQFSVAAWFKTSANFGSDAFIVNKGDIGSDSSGQNMNYGIWMTSTEQIKAGFETSTGADQFATSVSTYNDGQWHYVIVQYDGITVRLYIDGVQVATKSTSGASPETSGTEPVRVGANSGVTPPGNFFTGEVDEVRIWSDDLTSTERANAFAGTSFNTGEQVLYLSFTSSGAGTDIFGIKKLYPTKSNGEEWYLNMDNPLGDSRFNPQNTITKNPDGSWKMKSSQVRMNVYTSTGYDSANIPTLDHSVIASKGYMLAANDWRNFEMTQYVKVNTSPSDDNFAPYGRGSRHTGTGPPEGCEGSSIKGDLFFSGKVRFAKEQWHVSYVFTNIKTATGSIEDKWVGIKFIVYNFVENNKVVVKTELWLDTNNNGNFVKVDENVDRGGWGAEGTACGGAPDQVISWGGPITTFRWDTATDVDFKNLSVREIVSPQ